METTKILDFENNGVCMAADGEFLYLGSEGAINKYCLDDMSLTAHILLNSKKKKAVYTWLFFQIYDEYIFAYDFCTLHIVLKKDLQLLYSVRLGENVSSDILGVLDFNYPNVYVGIRGGKVDVLNIETKNVTRLEVSDSSSWSRCVNENRMYYSTTNGALLELERYTMREIRKVQLTKNMNIYSVVFHNDMLYTTAEKTFNIVDVNTFEAFRVVPDVMYHTESKIIGIYGETFVVAEYQKISLFDTQTLELRERFDFPTGYRHMREAYLAGDKLYGSDGHGIYCRILNHGNL